MSDKLNSIIKIFEEKFPSFKFVNATQEHIKDITFGSNGYAIVVLNIPSCKIKDLNEFADEIVFPKLIETGEELPLLIPLQINNYISFWNHAEKCLKYNSNANLIKDTAEDYIFTLAA